MKHSLIKFGIISAMALGMVAAPAFAGESTAGTKIGVLTCKTVPHTTVNLLVHSTTDVRCDFVATDGSGVEHYIGETGVGFGVDLSYKRESTIAFTVFAADGHAGNHKMAGKYVGAGASATVGAGVGAQVLVGGGDKSISLEPALEGNTGLGASAGLTYLYLQADK